MSEDRLQRSLNDYLDDRLDADERERFEERLVADEELARRLATARKIRKALRSGDEELSPGFYTRTVALFAAEHRRLPFGVTWSTIGLATAAIAAAVIFIPPVLREEIPEMPVAPQVQDEATRIPQDSRTDKGDRAGEDVASSLQSLGYVADDRALAEQDKAEFLVEESIAAPMPKSRDAAKGLSADLEAPVGGLAQEDRKRQTASEPPPPAAQQPERLLVVAPELEESDLGSGHTSDADPLGDAAGNETSKRVVVSKPADHTRESGVRTESGFYNLERSSVPSPVELPVDLVGIGEIELLDARDVQQRLGAGRKKEIKSASDSLASTESPAATRFVAIGRRPGLNACAALTVHRTDKAWEISYKDSGSSVGSVSCGIAIPDDGVEIRFQGWRVDG